MLICRPPQAVNPSDSGPRAAPRPTSPSHTFGGLNRGGVGATPRPAARPPVGFKFPARPAEDYRGREERSMPNRAVLLLVLACAVAGGGATRASAQSSGPDPACASNVPRSMVFAGVGAGLGLLTSGEQSVVQQAPSNIFNGGVLVTTGLAGGPPVTPFLGTKADCVPLAQLGYFRHFGDTNWLWGAKSSYIYQDKALTQAPLLLP